MKPNRACFRKFQNEQIFLCCFHEKSFFFYGKYEKCLRNKKNHGIQIQGVFLMIVKNLRDDRGPLDKQL